MLKQSTKVIAVVLPQFHPIPENDKWWGRGFTEWTNVAKARPVMTGHYQPHLPGELGFYDLRLPEARANQASLAAEHGITGFCYYHYWFNGQQLLDRPLREILTSGEPDFPFCICWANENWTRAWDGRDREVLMVQNYSLEDDLKHIDALIPYMKDSRYIRVGSRPLLIIYKSSNLPNAKETFTTWRRRAFETGLGEICIAQFESGGKGTAPYPATLDLDLSIEFMPDWRNLGGEIYSTPKARLAITLGLLPRAYKNHRICDYRRMVSAAKSRAAPDYPLIRCVSPGFDSTPRRPNGATILINNSPENYEEWLKSTIHWSTMNNSTEHRMVFINAWNEWGEGNHLEPDAMHGRAYLEATKRAIESTGQEAQI